MQPTPFINAIATAVPPYDVHTGFVAWAEARLNDRRARALFARMAGRSAIEHRWSVLPPPGQAGRASGKDAVAGQTGSGGFYDAAAWPGTAKRMALYAREAPLLAERAARDLGDLDGVTHLVVASCTGFIAPGIDQLLARRLGLADTVERCLVGFMGCYAAVAALRTAYHIVRSQADARVLVITVELCTLHLQATDDVEALLAMLLFADGAAAAIVSARPAGLAIVDPFSLALADSEALIGWTIGDTGFDMQLSGAVPGRIRAALSQDDVRHRLAAGGVDSWAVHAGGKSVLDAVEQALALPADALDASRVVLRDHGNMSSATLMFVLARIIAAARPVTDGVAMAFGPGLAVEGFRYRSAP